MKSYTSRDPSGDHAKNNNDIVSDGIGSMPALRTPAQGFPKAMQCKCMFRIVPSSKFRGCQVNWSLATETVLATWFGPMQRCGLSWSFQVHAAAFPLKRLNRRLLRRGAVFTGFCSTNSPSPSSSGGVGGTSGMVVMGVVSSEVLGGGVGTLARSVIEVDLKPPKD